VETPELHPNLAQVAELLGTWSGRGSGEYPSIEPFDYAETVTFTHVGKPFLRYEQRTRKVESDGSLGSPLHTEAGYWRFPETGRVEVVLSHPTGITEIAEGTLVTLQDGAIAVSIATASIGLSSTAKPVSAVERKFRLSGDTLEYQARMAAMGLTLQHHLAAILHRQPSGAG
jgi:hypothetical protein